MALDVAWARRWARESAAAIAAAKDELMELDRQIGDADHGENLNRGFQAVVAKLDAQPPPGTAADGDPAASPLIADVLKLVATTLMSSVGGASGPLYGTAYLRAAKVTGLSVLDAHGVVALLEGALEGITSRGKAVPGEKTMVDAWTPAVEAAIATADAGGTPEDVLEAAATASAAGAVATVPLLATKGRASYLGERSIGHEDPGAASSAIILRAAVRAAGATEAAA
ncbi:dihydroxyacetone kinase subunit DhaL [Sanguibacter antarcticus]|uniref:Dihydroxyacetone kinase DhaL subunit n=1 Tax=Sanguibacter antarcticus TaxID=372484 RepID=A0A2A9E410_9MICO|nr:dihydroxyacetone kinase subunit DhaL [Sanguibacter antarcticus]PFG33573.1 dihydroxyacetone kinase DhaL subunit [Sanguibacter antarcticus]